MKKALIISASLIGFFTLFGYKKYRDGQTILQNLDVRLKQIKNIRFAGNNLVFDAIVELINPTKISFSINTGSLVTLKKINYYDNSGNFIASSNAGLYKISIPAEKAVELPPMETTVSVFSGIDFLLKGGKANNIKTSAIIEALGNEYIIDQT